MKPLLRCPSIPSFHRRAAGYLALVLLATCAAAAAAGCSSSDAGSSATSERDSARPSEKDGAVDDAGSVTDGTVGDASRDPTGDDAATAGACPAAVANEAVYCQNFDTAAVKTGAWTLRGEPINDDAGVPMYEDTLQFWSPPRSRILSSFADNLLRGSAAGALPVSKSTLRFRARPDFEPYNKSGTYLAYVSLGDSTLAVGWIDYGNLDPSKTGTTGYALIHHVFGSSTNTWTALPFFPAKSVWSAIELSLSSSGAASIAFDGTVAAQLTVVVAPSTSASFGFGSYYSSSSSNPGVLSANIDDVVAVVTR